ncbi:MAG: hypothetical protein ACTHQE_04760 [Thermomicrobiales bacterium]
MSLLSHPFRLLSRSLAVLLLTVTASTSLLVASPAAASSTDDDAASDADCAPVAIAEDEWEDYGLTGRRAYESPQFGIEADWDRAWAVNEEADAPITSNEDCLYDELRLIWEDDDLYGLLILNFATPADVSSMDELVDGWSDDAFLASNWGKGYSGEVAIADSDDTVAEAVFSVVRDEDDAQYYVVYRTIALSDDVWLYVTYTTDEASFEDAWAALDEGVRVDGDPIPGILTWRAIDRAL